MKSKKAKKLVDTKIQKFRESIIESPINGDVILKRWQDDVKIRIDELKKAEKAT